MHGRVINSSNHKAIDYATVSLLQPTDSSIVSSTICDRDGAFSLPLHTTQTTGLLRASAVGYRTGFAYCSFPDSTITIELTEAAQMLGEVTINAKRIQRTATGYTVNLQSDKLTEGKQTNALLGMLPGITIQNNEISAYNLPIETIYVNGNKISNKEELAAIAAEELITVQVDLMPTGRDSGNNGGILYINTRKPKQNGCYGNTLLGAGVSPFYGFSNGRLSSVINAKIGKFSIYNYLYSGDNNIYYDAKRKQRLFNLRQFYPI